jgi:hypothetical protein
VRRRDLKRACEASAKLCLSTNSARPEPHSHLEFNMNQTRDDPDTVVDLVTNRLVCDVACRTCGYNLKSLAADADCPECGTAVELSLCGDFLAFANPDWLKVVRWGVMIVFIGAFLLTMTFLGILASRGFISGVITYVRSPSELVMLSLLICSIGALLTAISEPGAVSKRADIARLSLRSATVVAAITLIIFLTAGMFVPPFIKQAVINTMEFAGAGASLGVMAAQLHLMEILSLRIPDPRGAMRERVLKWTMPLCGFVWVVAVTARWGRSWTAWFAFSTRVADVARVAGLCFVIHWLAYVFVLAQFCFYIRREEGKARKELYARK